MIDPIDRSLGKTPSNQELADKLNEVIEQAAKAAIDLETFREALGALLTVSLIEPEDFDGTKN